LTQLRTDEFVYPKLMAWEGAFGIVPQECDGCYVSPEFPVFEINQSKVLPKFLGYYFLARNNWSKIAGDSIGTNVRRRRLYPDQLLRFPILLPTLEEQGRAAAYLDEVRSKIDEAQFLRREAAAERAFLWARAAGQLLADAGLTHSPEPLGSLLA